MSKGHPNVALQREWQFPGSGRILAHPTLGKGPRRHTQMADKSGFLAWPAFGLALAKHLGVIDGLANQIEQYMDLLSARQKLVASNIANLDTPGYKAKDIDFQFELMSLSQGQSPNVIDTPGLVVKSDGNNVSLDREARLLSENALRFSVASTLMKAQLKTVESAIKEGQSG
jgi:flagellar basal-body rod protein FlgB